MMKNIIQLVDLAEFITGTSQFRINESLNDDAKSYQLYSQTNLREDEQGIIANSYDNKTIRTSDNVTTLSDGDIVFSLISGLAVIVGEKHGGYLYTQNYIKLIPNEKVDKRFLVYFLNENKEVRRQLQTGLQGSIVMKFTLKQLKELNLAFVPLLSKQKAIGEIYYMQLRLNMLRHRTADLEYVKVLRLLEEELNK